jgi:hypothetical protein
MPPPSASHTSVPYPKNDYRSKNFSEARPSLISLACDKGTTCGTDWIDGQEVGPSLIKNGRSGKLSVL